jgi:hypothetical protein
VSDLVFEMVEPWLGATTDVEDATFGALRIAVGDIVLTEVEDTISRTTRESIRVPASLVAEWLLTRWWRLRWEARPERPTHAWRSAHSLAAVGEGYAWPSLDISSDGERVRLEMAAEARRDVAAVRYLRAATLEVPASDFERAVDRFLDVVEERVASTLPGDATITELRAELRAERADPVAARRCRWQARAGFDAGDAPDGWLDALERLAVETGERAMDEALAGASLDDAPAAVQSLVRSLRRTALTVDLPNLPVVGAPEERTSVAAWKRASQAAHRARAHLGLGPGPISDERLSEILGVRLPFPAASVTRGHAGGLRGDGVTRLLVPSEGRTSQRFYLARLMGLSIELGSDQRLLPVHAASTAAQRYGRAFGQELLLPWAELQALTDEEGTDDDTLVAIGERYGVSEMLVATTLVNRGVTARATLERFEG